MKMTLINDLINDFRHNKGVRGEFNMGNFIVDPGCGTAACIAGHVQLRTNILNMKTSVIEDSGDQYLLDNIGVLGDQLGLSELVAHELFYPDIWADNQFSTNHYGHLSGNLAPAMETVKQMKEFAQGFVGMSGKSIYSLIGPDEAADALQHTIDCPGYMNWAKVLEDVA